MRLRGWQKNLLLAVAATGLTLLAAEGVLRLVWHADGQHTVIRHHPVYGWALRPRSLMHSVSTGRGLDYHIQVNSLGLRDRERSSQTSPGTQRVLFVGDSVVFGAGVEFGDRCSDQLERALGPGVEVVNAGVSGWGTDQEYLWLTHEGWALHPDVVVLGLCVLNDVINVMLPHELFGTAPKPRFVLDSGTLRLEPVPRPAPPRPAVRLAAVLKHSRLLHFVGRHVRLLQLHTRPHPQPAPGTHPLYYPEDFESDASHWAVFRKQYTPRLESAFRVTEALVTAMRDSCAARGIPLVLFAFPNKVEVDAAAREHELAYYGYDPEMFDLGIPYARLQTLAERLAVPFLYPVEAFATAREPLFFAHDGHPNAAGHAVAARSLEPVLRAALDRTAETTHATRP